MRFRTIIISFLLYPFIAESFAQFDQNFQIRSKRSVNKTDECCVRSKLNVGTKKANQGRDFFRRLATEDDSYKLINPENMCNLMHFLIQQATLNNKSVSFTKGMFVVIDSTNKIFERIIKAKDEQKSGDGEKHVGYFKRLKHMGHQAIEKLFKSSKRQSDVLESDVFIYVRGDESSHYHSERGSKDDRRHDYPAYGMDIPGACMPSGFGHILFGELPPISLSPRYTGERIYIKPEFFGIRKIKDFMQHAKSYFNHVSRRYVCQLKDMQTKPGCSSEDAFRENTDKKLLEKWKHAIINIPSAQSQSAKYIQNATKYGISEIYQQLLQFENSGYSHQVKEVRDSLIKHYGEDDLIVRKGREIIFTTNDLLNSPLTCDLFSSMKKC